MAGNMLVAQDIAVVRAIDFNPWFSEDQLFATQS